MTTREGGHKPTLADIAGKAGVSMKSVSLGLRGQPGVAPDTLQRIRAAADELGYKPRGNPSSENKETTARGIGFAINERPGRRTILVIDSLTGKMQDLGYAVMIYGVGKSQSTLQERLDFARNRTAGIILFEPEMSFSVAELRKAAKNKPVLVVGGNDNLETDTQISSLSESGKEAAELAVDYMASLGHQKIAYLGERVGQGNYYQEKQTGFESAMIKRGLNPALMVSTSASLKEDQTTGYTQMHSLLRSGAEPTAILAASESLAVGARNAIHDQGLSIPGDISLMAFGDDNFADFYTPTLTTVQTPIDQLVAEQTRWVLRYIMHTQGYENSTIRKPLPVMTLRNSTGPAPVKI